MKAIIITVVLVLGVIFGPIEVLVFALCFGVAVMMLHTGGKGK